MAPAAADAIFVDTNVLLAANVVTHPKHAIALARQKCGEQLSELD
jgi:predicted nucleic acid-binding protein